MKNYILGIIRLSLPLFASVAVAGVSAPPSGTVFNYTVFLGIDCKATPPTVTPNEDGDAYLLAHSSQSLYDSAVIDYNQINLLSRRWFTWTASQADTTKRIQLDGNIIRVRADTDSNWITFGTFSDVDVQNYCSSHQGEARAELPVALAVGTQVSISRQAQHTFCLSSIGDGASGRMFDYYVKIRDSAGIEDTLVVQQDVRYPDSSDCKNSKDHWETH